MGDRRQQRVNAGVLLNGSTWLASNVKVPDIGNNPTKTDANEGPTEFTITETPQAATPLPAAAAGGALCLLVLAAGRLHVRRALHP